MDRCLRGDEHGGDAEELQALPDEIVNNLLQH
jgi:hypothetical protein